MSTLKEASSQLNGPAPVPEESLCQLGVLSQGMCLQQQRCMRCPIERAAAGLAAGAQSSEAELKNALTRTNS